MAKIAVFGEGISLAHVTRAMLVARELLERGHDVVFATGPRYADWTRHRGIDPRVVATSDAQPLYDRLRRVQPMYLQSELKTAVESDLALIEAESPDVVVGDCRNSLRIATELAAVPYAAIINANNGPWFSGRINSPQRLPLNRWVGKKNVDRWLMPIFGRLGRTVVCRKLGEGFAEVQQQFGCRRRDRDLRDIFISSDLNLIADLPELMPCRDLPEHCQYIGPLFWGDDPVHDAPTRRLLKAMTSDRPLVYVTLGSTGAAEVLHESLEDLGQLHATFIISGVEADADSPENARFVRFVSAPPVLERAAAVVCHGGSGSVYQALAFELPVLAIPTFFDQEIQSDQMAASGLVRRLLPRESLADVLADMLPDAEQLQSRQVRAHLAARIHASDAPRRAADAIEGLAGMNERASEAHEKAG